MKLIFIFCFVFIALSEIHSQEYAFTVYLYNGTVLTNLLIRSADEDSVIFSSKDSSFLINPDSIKMIHLFRRRAPGWGLMEGFVGGAIAGGALGMIAGAYSEEESGDLYDIRLNKTVARLTNMILMGASAALLFGVGGAVIGLVYEGFSVVDEKYDFSVLNSPSRIKLISDLNKKQKRR